ncbi:MAG TPA: PAS domain S-box protein [Alphaproteobacteria bacterium]
MTSVENLPPAPAGPSSGQDFAPGPVQRKVDTALDLIARIVMTGAASFVTSWIAITLTRTTGSVAAIWPTTAILLAILFRSKPSHWPGYLLAGYAAGVVANLMYGDNLLLAAGLPFGNVVETALAAIVLRRCFPDGVNLREIRQLAAMVIVAMLAAAASGATLGAGILDVVHVGNFWRNWFNWWTGVGTGIVLITPVMLTWRPADDEGGVFSAERMWESAAALACAAVGTAILFNQGIVSLIYALFPLLIWSALRLSVFTTAAVCLVIALVAIPLTAFGHGPLAMLDVTLDIKLRLLQTFLTVITLTALSIAIALQRRNEVETVLRASEQRFRDFADSISDRFWETDENHRFTWRLEPSERLRLWPSIIGKTRFDLAGVDPASDPLWRKHLEDLDAHRPFRDFRYSLRDLNGRLRFRSISGKPIYGRNGKFLGYRGTSTDITDNMETELLATRLGRVVDEALNEIYIVDVQTHHFMFANRRARDNLGYEMEELRDMTVLDICPSLSKDDLLRSYAELDTRRTQTLTLDSAYQRKDGSHYDVEAHLQRFDVSGLSPIYTLIVIDITSRKRVHSELASKSVLLQATLDNMAQGLCVYDKDLRLVGYNQKFVSLLGLPPASISIGSAYADNVARFARHSLGMSEAQIPDYIAERIAEAGTRFMRRRVHRLPDGTIIASNRRPMPEGGFVTTYSDITERVQTEEALRLSATELQEIKASFEAAILASRQILYEWDLGDDNIRWSGETATLLGYAPQELGGLDSLMALVHPDDLAAFESELLKEEEIGVSFHMEYRLRHKNGHYVHVSDVGVYLAGRAGKDKRVVGFIADLTAQKSAAEALRQSDKLMAIGQLTGGIAHDFNNLLAIVRGNLELLDEDLGQASAHHQRIQTAMSAADRGSALTQRLLAFARKQPLEPQATHLNRLIVDMGDLMRRSLHASIKVDMSLADDLWLTSIDPNSLESALLNLVLNARDAMPEGGTLTIETANTRLDEAYTANLADVTPGQYVMLTVTDTGAGMAPEVRDRVFDPFFTTKEMGRGSGLGLAMVYGFVKQSRGHVAIDSAPDLGTSIRLYLPREDVPAAAEPPETKSPMVDGGGELILIVEDDPDVRMLANAMVQSLGYRTLTAPDAGTALNVLADQPGIDLMFTDIVLPGGMNGADLAQLAIERYPGLKILYTSGYTENAILHDGGLEGSRLISKPYRKIDLAHKLRQVLDGDTDDGR